MKEKRDQFTSENGSFSDTQQLCGESASCDVTNPKKKRNIGYVLGRIGIVVLGNLLLVVMLLYGMMLVIARGPSNTLKELFVMTVKETSAGGFLANMCLSNDEIEAILAKKQAAADDEDQKGHTNTDLIKINTDKDKTPSSGSDPTTPDTGTSSGDDENDTGIEVVEVRGATYRGTMMIISDPSRVTLGIPDAYGENCVGLKLRAMMEKYDAIAGINAGGFVDVGGTGKGGQPTGIIIKDGTLRWGGMSGRVSIIGFDSNHILHVGTMSAREALDAGVTDACSFGPALIINGIPCNSTGNLSGGYNPRTAIGQRADGAVLMLVVEGRQLGSLGATFDDLVEIMQSFDAVNASNLDGGGSSLMVYDGGSLNTSAYIYGERVLASSFLVLKK